MTRADTLIRAALEESYLTTLPKLRYWKRPSDSFNAMIDKHGRVVHGDETHHELAATMVPRRPNSDETPYFQDVIADHGVRALVGYSDRGEDRDVFVQMRHDSDIARRHAASFINDHHREPHRIMVDYTPSDGSEAKLVDSKIFTSKADALSHLLTRPRAANTDIARAREFKFGGSESADQLILQALNESTHNSIRKAFRSNRSYELLDADPEIRGSTWASGGCGVAARALHKVMGGEIKSVVDQHGVHHHAVLHHGGRFYDMDGEHTEAQMLGKMARREGVKNPRIAPFDQSKYKGKAETVGALAAHLGGLNEATLIPHDDNKPGRARYDIEHEGKQIGRLAVQTVDHAPELPAGSRAGKLGVRLNPDARGSRTLVRDVLRQLRDRHPDLTHVGGFRLSGTRARWDNDQKSTTDRYTWVKLRDALR